MSRALLFLLERAKLVVEPAGASAVGWLLENAEPSERRGPGRRGPVGRQHRPAAHAADHPPRHGRGRPLPPVRGAGARHPRLARRDPRRLRRCATPTSSRSSTSAPGRTSTSTRSRSRCASRPRPRALHPRARRDASQGLHRHRGALTSRLTTRHPPRHGTARRARHPATGGATRRVRSASVSRCRAWPTRILTSISLPFGRLVARRSRRPCLPLTAEPMGDCSL